MKKTLTVQQEAIDSINALIESVDKVETEEGKVAVEATMYCATRLLIKALCSRKEDTVTVAQFVTGVFNEHEAAKFQTNLAPIYSIVTGERIG